MGQALSEPITTKHSTEGEAEKLIYGASSMQGWRIKMEDAHITLLDYEQTGIAFFAVMDGHGGDRVAKYSSQHLAPNILNSKEFNKDRMMSIKKGFLKTDSDLRQDPDLKDDHSGCTAIVVLVDNDVIYVGNVGDSRAVISTGGKASALSKDHKPNDANESKRIKNAGGHIKNGRVNGNLALSRALGDFGYKTATDLPPEKQAVTASPDVTQHTLTNQDEFMVLACDGIWDCMTNQQVVDFIRQEISQEVPLKIICEHIMDHCLSDQRRATLGLDNMTIEIVGFLHAQSKETWYKNIKSTLGDNIIHQENLKSESREYSKEELEIAPDLVVSEDNYWQDKDLY